MADRDGEKRDDNKKKGVFREYTEALTIAIVIALLIRCFIFEAFKIPSGSMIPTLTVGDHIFVNKFIYGLRIPFTKKRFFKFHSPERGDVIVFIYPKDEKLDFIKRIVGLPGDRVQIKGEDLWINGEKVVKTTLNISEVAGDVTRLKRDGDGTVPSFVIKDDEIVRFGWKDFDFFEEEISGKKHIAIFNKHVPERDSYDIIVPDGSYFVLGDDRDHSKDGRYWGFVPDENIKGKAMFVWLPIDSDFGFDIPGVAVHVPIGIRWHEFGRWIR